MRRLVGIDLAITADNRACIMEETGRVLAERPFGRTRGELEGLLEVATDGLGQGDELVVVMEPTANAWVAPAALFSSKGAVVHLVPPEQSADLRRYYAKHVKNDRIDAKLLARIPLLHPEGLHPAPLPEGARGTLRRVVTRRRAFRRSAPVTAAGSGPCCSFRCLRCPRHLVMSSAREHSRCSGATATPGR